MVDDLADDVHSGVPCRVEALVQVDRETSGLLQGRRVTPIAIDASDSPVIASMAERTVARTLSGAYLRPERLWARGREVGELCQLIRGLRLGLVVGRGARSR